MSLCPPFNAETAHEKVKAAQDLWNTRDPVNVALKGYTPDSIWRNRDKFLNGTAEIIEFLTAKWQRELDYRLRKELFAFSDDRIAVQFWSISHSAVEYEYRTAEGGWFRCYGLEDWTFAKDGKMRKRQMSGNDVKIEEGERWFKDGVDVNTIEISERHW